MITNSGTNGPQAKPSVERSDQAQNKNFEAVRSIIDSVPARLFRTAVQIFARCPHRAHPAAALLSCKVLDCMH